MSKGLQRCGEASIEAALQSWYEIQKHCRSSIILLTSISFSTLFLKQFRVAAIMKVVAAAVFLAEAVHAFPWVSHVPGVDSSMLVARQQPGTGPGSEATCPNNPNHVNAAPVTTKYPYNNALNGKKGNEKGGFRVPAVGDTAHRYIAPTARDIRGPCPGCRSASIRIVCAKILTFL